MPKNASSYVLACTNSMGWTTAEVGDNCDWHLVQEMAVILRDPVDRWISGICQYVTSYILQRPHKLTAQAFVNDFDVIVERLIFDVVNRFDDHVWPQNELCANVLPGVARRYFWLDNTFDHKFQTYLGSAVLPKFNRNSAVNDHEKQVLVTFFQNLLLSRPDLKKRVIDAYADDYAFIERVKNEMV